MWSTDAQDPTYQLWTEQVRQEMKRQGLRDTEIHFFYGYQGEESDTAMATQLAREIQRLTSEGHNPDVILSHGDYLYWMLLSMPGSSLDAIPAVCYGLTNAESVQGSVMQQNEAGHERPALVRIKEEIDIQRNLDFADYILNLPTHDDSLHNWTGLPQNHRFCSLLDPIDYWIDALRFAQIEENLSMLDSTRYFNNFYNATEEDSLIAYSQRGGIVYSCRSLRSPNFNINPQLHNQIPNKWAFYPRMSPNHFVQVKHDNSSRACTEGAEFSPYFTMIAEDFLSNDSCIGGCFTSFNVQARDAVNAAVRLLDGEQATQIGPYRHTPEYHINWDALRGKGLMLDQIPEYVNLHHVTFRDANPRLYIVLHALGALVVALLLLTVCIFARRAIRKQRHNAALLHEQAQKAIRNRLILRQTLLSTGALSWRDEGEDYSLLRHLMLNDFYKEKVATFLHQQKDGSYSMQFQGSVGPGAQHWYDLRMNVSHDRHGVVVRQGVFVNIDHQKEQESRNMEVHALLMNAKAREGFINAMYHEVRTPLNAVVGYAQVLSMPGMDCTPEELEEYSTAIESNAAVLKKMINDLLLVTLMNNSTITAQCQPLTMNSQMDLSLWKEAAAMVKYRHNNVVWDHKISGISVNADPKMLAVVMENLVLNASKFSDEGSTITIGWGLKMNPAPAADDSTEQADAEIWVHDEGKGIDVKYHEMIFDRFFKIDSFQPGCGLGLFICKTYVEMMGGSISFDSKPGQGTTFRITLHR